MKMVKRHLGFSLIELMIAVAIIGITASLAFPNFRVWIENTRIRNTTESILTGLQLARAEAVRRNANVAFTLDGGSEWTVGCQTPVGDGSQDTDCPAVIQSRTSGDDKSASVIVTASEDGPYVFNSLGRVSPKPAAGGFIQLDVDMDTSVMSADDSRELRVNIGVGGDIKMCDPAVTSDDDLRKCP